MRVKKRCSKCGCEKDVSEFHKQPSGKYGRHSYCRECANAIQRETRARSYSPEAKRRWQMKTRYGITQAQYTELFDLQGGVCAICGKDAKLCVDHCHETGVVRGLLCHKCNIRLGGWDDAEWRASAVKYLELVR